MRKVLTSLGVVGVLFSFLFSLLTPGLVRGETVALPDGEIQKAIQVYLTASTPWQADQMEITSTGVLPKLTLHPGPYRLEVQPTTPRATLIGKTLFDVRVYQGDSVRSLSHVEANIKIWVDAVLTAKPVKGGDVLRPGDLYMGKRDLATLANGYLPNIDDLYGKQTKFFVGANLPLLRDNLKETPVFIKGDRVMIVAESEAIRVLTMGEAKESGYQGKMVKVINLQSRKEITGSVDADGTVKVRF